MILSEHTFKENDVKLIVIEFLSTLESVTSWLEIHECMYEVEVASWTRVHGTV